jgi:hypothetical protein
MATVHKMMPSMPEATAHFLSGMKTRSCTLGPSKGHEAHSPSPPVIIVCKLTRDYFSLVVSLAISGSWVGSVKLSTNLLISLVADVLHFDTRSMACHVCACAYL